ncbi:hypothetical protein ACFL0T_05915 [Candidatus Omnitrophota bacterium]
MRKKILYLFAIFLIAVSLQGCVTTSQNIRANVERCTPKGRNLYDFATTPQIGKLVIMCWPPNSDQVINNYAVEINDMEPIVVYKHSETRIKLDTGTYNVKIYAPASKATQWLYGKSFGKVSNIDVEVKQNMSLVLDYTGPFWAASEGKVEIKPYETTKFAEEEDDILDFEGLDVQKATFSYKPPRDLELNYKIAIGCFNDMRPDAERGKVGHKLVGFYTNDETFKNNLTEKIANSLSDVLERSDIFKEVNIEDFSSDIQNNLSELDYLKEQSYNIAITGTIVHCVGFQLTESSGSTGFGVAGVLLDAVANQRMCGARVEYNPVTVINLNTNDVIWTGNIDYIYKKSDTFYDSPHGYAKQGIKSANNKLLEKLVELLGE